MCYRLVKPAALHIDRGGVVIQERVARRYLEELLILGSRLREHAFFPVRGGEVEERIPCDRRVRVFACPRDLYGPAGHLYPLIETPCVDKGGPELVHGEVVLLRAQQRGLPERYIVLPAHIPEARNRRVRQRDGDKGCNNISICPSVLHPAP